MPDPQSPSNDRPRRIVIAGFGLLTPLGHDAWGTFAALLAGRTLADRAEQLPGEVDPVNLVRALGAVSIAHHTVSDPAIELLDRAAREAAFAAGVETRALPAYLGTSKGAVHAWTHTAQAHAEKGELDPLPVVLGPHGYIAHHLRRRLGVMPTRHTVAACASGLAALHAARTDLLTRDSGPDHALVLSADAALLPAFVHSYRRLGVLAPLTPADYRQRPLNEQRTGFMLAEAGAAVLLRRVPREEPPASGEIELLDTAVAGEGYDLIRSPAEMPAFRQLTAQLLDNRQIDLIHPHAPGTPEHDPAELAALFDGVDEARNADLYACKGAIGHSLGAAGLSALVLACLCARAGRRPPMPWIEQPINVPGDAPPIETAARTLPAGSTHAVLAAGFAGHLAGAVVQRRP